MSRLVVIADADAERANRLRGACAARGFSVRIARSGADALEAAVSQVPEALIAAGPLRVITSAKLVEILRTNPRTRRIQCTLIGTPETPIRPEWGVNLLPTEADPEAIADHLAKIVSPEPNPSERNGAPDEIEGSLAQIPLADLLQLFHMNRRTGVFEMKRRNVSGAPERGRVTLRDGDVIQAVVDSIEGEKAFFRLLTWEEGSFRFRACPVTMQARIAATTRGLLLEGMRQLDEWKRHRADLPPLDAHVSVRLASPDLPRFSHPLTQEVLLLLELYSRVGDVVDHTSAPDYQVLRTLQNLIGRRIVEIRVSAPTPPPQHSVFHAAQIRRLRDFLRKAQADGAPPRDAKVLVAAHDGSTLNRFRGLLSELPGLQAHPAMHSEIATDEVVALARLRVDDDLGIEFVVVPTEPSFAPLWPLAGHQALGTLLVMSGQVEEAAARVRPFQDALRGLPGARLFHLLMVQADDDSIADQIRRNVELLGDSEFFLLPEGREKTPSDLLRNAVSRLAP